VFTRLLRILAGHVIESGSFNILVNPNAAEAEAAVKEAFAQHQMLIVVGSCWVRYVGRATSRLEKGERVLMLKADGSVLIHRATSYEPVNWMPGGGVILHVQNKDLMLEIRAVRQKPPESVRVFFDLISMVYSSRLRDSASFSLHASEADMQRALLIKPQLLEEGLKIISYEKKVEPGFVDVYGVDVNGKLVVVEIKRRTAGKEAALQLARYIEAIRDKADRQVRGVLAAPGIARDVQRLLATLGLEYKHLDPRKCSETLGKGGTKKLAEFFREKAN
jgi:RecB family endonuclease NucS